MEINHIERVFKAIDMGFSRPATIVKATCLGPEHVKKALSQLRKARKVEVIEGEYKIPEMPNE